MAHSKSADAFRTISEAAEELDVPQHVLRHWEDAFGQIRPMRRAGGRRYYRPVDLDLLRGVRVLLYEERYTTRGVQKIFKENGAKYIAEIGRMSAAGQSIELRPILNEEAEDRDDATPALTNADDQHETDAGRTADADARSPTCATPPYQDLASLLDQLERAQAALDETVLALEAIAPDTDPRTEANSK